MKYIKLKQLLESNFDIDSNDALSTMKRIHIKNLDEFTKSYIDGALFTSTDNLEDNGGRPLDKNYTTDDIASETLTIMIEDCKDFQQKYRNLYLSGEWTDSEAGYDFWLTRNDHGTGFWDRGYKNEEKEKIGKELTKYAKMYGSFSLYLGDGAHDGLIYGMRG